MGLSNPHEPPATAIGRSVEAARRATRAPLRWLPATACCASALFETGLGPSLPSYVTWLHRRIGMRPFGLASPAPGRMVGQIPARSLLASVAAALGLAGARTSMRRGRARAVAAAPLCDLPMAVAMTLLSVTGSPRLPERP